MYPFEGFAICKCFKLCISRVFASAVLPVNQLDRMEAAPQNKHCCERCQPLKCADEGSGEVCAVPVRPQDLVMQSAAVRMCTYY